MELDVSTPGMRLNRRLGTPPSRQIHVGIDGKHVIVALTQAEERRLRAQLRPFIAAARRVPSDRESVELHFTLSDELRKARVEALLGRSTGASTSRPDLDHLVSRTAEVYAKSLAPESRAAYARRWNRFVDWCAAHEIESLPADPATVMLYLAEMADQDPRPALSTLRGHVNAINRIHLEYGVAIPGDDPALGMLMRGLSHVVPHRWAEPVSALRIDSLRTILRHLDHPDPIVLRDAALLRLLVAGVAVNTLARLHWSDVRFNDDHVLLGTRTTRSHPPTAWQQVDGSPDDPRSPVRALLQWRSMATTNPVLVFTTVDKDGRRSARGLRQSGIHHVIESRLDSLIGAKGRVAMKRAADLLDEVASDVLRDRALLLLGFAAASRRGELTRLTWGDIRFVDEGLIVRIQRSKTDPLGLGVELGIPWGHAALTCPVRAMQAWRDRVRAQLGEDFTDEVRVFVRVGRAGRVSPEHPLTNEGLTMVVKRRAAQAGLDGLWGGRSLRAGLISTAADLDIPLELIARQSRHASLDSLMRYVRYEDPFRRNAVNVIGL